MPYGFSGAPPALPALPGFGGGSPLFKPGLPGIEPGGVPAPNSGPLGSPSPAPAINPYQTDINGSASVPAAPVTDPCAGIQPCSWTNMSPCISLLICKTQSSIESGVRSAWSTFLTDAELGAKSAGAYLAAAGIAVVGIYLLIRK